MSKYNNKTLKVAEQILQTLKNAGLLNNEATNDASILTLLAKDLADDTFVEAGVLTKNTTILLSDIRGFSALADSHSAPDVVKMLNRYFDCMGSVIATYGGRIDKLMGDSIMVAFGIPEETPQDVENAIACAIEMQIAMTDLNIGNQAIGLPELFMGIGLNTGSVVSGELGSKYYHEHTIIGDQVNLTSRIEAQCLRGQILISENTYKQCKMFVDVGPPNTVQVKGSHSTIDLYELISTTKPTLIKVPRREERKSPRVKVNSTIFFQNMAGKMVLDEKFMAEAIDLSYHGLLIKTNIKLAASSEIKLALSFNLFSDRSSVVYARIVKTQKVGNSYQSSLEFTTIDSAGLEAIKQYVDDVVGAT